MLPKHLPPKNRKFNLIYPSMGIGFRTINMIMRARLDDMKTFSNIDKINRKFTHLCTCGDKETFTHILMKCPNYKTERQAMWINLCSIANQSCTKEKKRKVRKIIDKIRANADVWALLGAKIGLGPKWDKIFSKEAYKQVNLIWMKRNDYYFEILGIKWDNELHGYAPFNSNPSRQQTQKLFLIFTIFLETNMITILVDPFAPANKKRSNNNKYRVAAIKRKGQVEARMEALEYKKQHPSISLRRLRQLFNVPIATMSKLINNKTQVDSVVGRQTYFTMQEEEEELKRWVFEMVDHGFAVSSDLLIFKAQEMYQVKYNTKKRISYGWYQTFRERHADVVMRSQDHISLMRKKSENPSLVKQFFRVLEECIEHNHLLPNQIFNCDETGIVRTNSTKFTLAKLGSRNVRINVPSNRALSSILVCCNAAGNALPPFYIHPGKSIKFDYFNNKIPDACVGVSSKGYMTASLFKQRFHRHFLKHCGSHRPVLLLLDSHASHVDLEVLKIAKDNNVILFALPPHTSHLYQPLDVAIFHPLKSAFARLTSEFLTTNPNGEPTHKFVEMLYDAHEQAVNKTNIIHGFAASRIYPCDAKQGIAKLQKPQIQEPSSQPSPIFKEILQVPSQPPLQKINTSASGESINFILSSNELLKLLRKLWTRKEKDKQEKEEKKRKRMEHKKEKEEEDAKRKLLKEQKANAVFCRCHHACLTNKSCPCKSAGKACTEYCSCKAKCGNINTSDTPGVSAPSNSNHFGNLKVSYLPPSTKRFSVFDLPQAEAMSFYNFVEDSYLEWK
nr:unnamed protein product [Naegleria fowleri]